MKGTPAFKKIAFYGVVVIALIVIAKYAFNTAPAPKSVASNTRPKSTAINSVKTTKDDPAAIKQQINTAANSKTNDKSSNTQEANKSSAETPSPVDNAAIKILKSEVTANAKFYAYKLDGVTMEVLAVKASDGTIRTALNTCQICFDSGRGYYKQIGEYLVCQNCDNRFNKDQVEIIKGGCNPIPILEDNKQDAGDYIIISKDYMAAQKDYFSNWQKE